MGPAPSSPQGEQIAEIVERHIAEHALRAVLVEVTIGDELVLSRAWGESMTGVPATTDMRFRNGAVAFAYLGHLLMQFVDAGTVGLDDTIDAWFPELPAADAVTLRMLAGRLLSEASYHAMTDSALLGFGERLASCAPSCFTQVEGYKYGLGVVRSGGWILQNPQLGGYSAVMAYLPAERISIAVATTYGPEAFDADGGYQNASDAIFRAIGAAVARDAPPMPR